MNQKLLAIAIASALAAPMAAQAIDHKISGHVNRGVMFIDDGAASDVTQTDNMASQSRLTWSASGDLGVGGMKAGAVIEYGMSSNRSSGVTVKGRNGNTTGADATFNVRHSRLWFSGNWGKVTMGHGSGAYDGAAYKDQGGSVFLTGIENGGTTWGGGTAFRTNTGAAAGNTVGQAFSNLDGGRYDNLRYDSPKLGPLQVAVDIGDNQRWSAAATLSTSFSGASVVAKAGYEDNENDGGSESYGGSASVLFSQGTNITFAYAQRDLNTVGRDDPDNFFVKLGHRWGPDRVNSVAIAYNESNDVIQDGDEATSWGIGFAHDIPGPRVQLYTGYRNFDLDRPGANIEDVDSFNVGARVRF